MNNKMKASNIDCQQFKIWLLKIHAQEILQLTSDTMKVQELLHAVKLDINKYTNLRTEIKQSLSSSHSIILDIRTYICANGKCNHNVDRKHRRISNYNYNKMSDFFSKTNIKLNNITEEILYIWMKETENEKNNIMTKKFIKECETNIEYKRDTTIQRYKPIETVFDMIDNMAKINSNNIMNNNAPAAPGNKIEQINAHRMTYGDINYLGGNKALLYFYRGIRGTQTFTNSMYSLKSQPSYKDTIIVDDIVFTSSCKCDSALQHKEMFPHYRVTCAVGLTCPARLNSYEKIAYARSRNASTETFTTARAMLVRYW